MPLGCSFGSIVALEWIGKPYRLSRIDMPEVVSSDAYRRINPVAETPALMTARGDIIAESLAILNHIGAGAIETGLAFRQGTGEFDALNQALAFLNTTFFDSFTPLWHLLEHEVEGAEKEALTAYGRAKVAKAHAHLEGMLARRAWLAGPTRTLADAYFMGIARWADFHQAVDRADYPRVDALRRRLSEDPAVRFAHAIERGEPAASAGGLQGHVDLGEVLAELRAA